MNLRSDDIKRSDSWDVESDNILAEVVLNHIRKGSTQLAGFQEVAQRLKRTQAACGFRWNGVVRKLYVSDIQEAKLERKAQANVPRSIEPDIHAKIETVTSTSAFQEAISFLRNFESEFLRLQRANEELTNEREMLLTRIQTLESSIVRPKMPSNVSPEQLEKDSQMLMEIVNRAREVLKL